MAAKPVRLVSGDTWQRAWTIKAPDGSPVNLSGAEPRLQLRDRNGGLVLEANTANGYMTVSPSDGRIDMLVPYTNMQLPAGVYQFELEVTYPNGVRRTYETNQIEIVPDITHD